MDNFRIGIIGNIGAGKSTLIDFAARSPYKEKLLSFFPALAENGEVLSFEEQFNEEVLDAFYKDPKSNAFMAQIEFFNGRLRRQEKIQRTTGVILEDRTIFEDYHVFGKAQYHFGSMSRPEFICYQDTFKLMTRHIKEPDLYIYLKADSDTLLARINKRGRDSEKLIERDYLEVLNKLYNEFIDLHISAPVITINIEDYNENKGYFHMIFDKVAEKISEMKLSLKVPQLSEWVNLSETDAIIKSLEVERKLEKFLKKYPKLITVAGNVGLGKSTLTSILQRSLSIEGLYEKPEDNKLLELFLGDKKKYCFDLQMEFLNMRSELRLKGKNGLKSYVKDRSIPEDVLIFCRSFYNAGLLEKDELDLLFAEFRKACQALPNADLLITLRGSTDLSWSRIVQRNRKMEVDGGWTYGDIDSLNNFYQTFKNDVVSYGFHEGPVLEIDMDMLDMTNRAHVGYVFENIYELLMANKLSYDEIKDIKNGIENE